MFTNLLMAWGLAAVAIPILIHLLNRQRYRTVEWAAMEFLLKAIKKNARKLQLRDIILMLIRASAVLCFVLALMRPVVCSYATGGYFGGETVRITVVDISGSMDANDGGKTVLQSTVEAVRETTKESAGRLDSKTKNVLLTCPGDTSIELPDGASDPQVFDGHLAAIKQSGGSADIARTMDRVREMVTGRYKNATVEQYLFTDMQRSSWDLANKELADNMRAIAGRGQIYLVDVGNPVKRNLTIESFRSADDTVLTGHEIPFVAAIKNSGAPDADASATAELLVDGQVKYQQVVSVKPGATEQLTFTVRPDTRGEHRVTLRLSSDNLGVDNEANRILLAEDKMRVMIVDGNPRDFGADSPGLFLKKVFSTSDIDLSALDAGDKTGANGTTGANGATARSAGLAIARISVDEWPEQNLADAQLICLANVPSIPPGMGAKLKRFVARGGGLMIFPGNDIDVANYQRELGVAPPPAADKSASATSPAAPATAPAGTTPATAASDDNLSLLPCAWGPWWGEVPDPKSTAPIQFKSLSDKDVSHPIMLPFSDSGEYKQLLANVRVYKALEMNMVADNSPDLSIVARLAGTSGGDGKLLAAIRSVGSGQVLQWSCPCDTQMSNLPWFGAYFIIMERSAEYLTIGSHPPLNLYAGDDLLHPVGELEKGAYYQLTDPFGRKETIPAPYRRGARWVVSPPENPLYPGFLTLQKGASAHAADAPNADDDSAAAAGGASPQANRTDYAISPRPNEFDLSPLNETTLRNGLPGVDFSFIKGSKKLAETLIAGSQGIELWWFFILLVFALLCLESYLVILWKPGGSADDTALSAGVQKSGYGFLKPKLPPAVPTGGESPTAAAAPAATSAP